jgi:SSS family solute:Na+ symporter
VTDVHFLYIAPLLFVLSTAVLILVSLCSEPKEGVEVLMWRAEVQPDQAVRWYTDFRILSLLLLVLTAFVVGVFA